MASHIDNNYTEQEALAASSGSGSSGIGLGAIGSYTMSALGFAPADQLNNEMMHDGHFAAAWVHAFMMVVATEIGDKTFFIAALLWMSKPFIVVFLGAWGALAGMTVLSAFMGLVLPSLLAKEYVHWFVISLFCWFGGKALFDGVSMFMKGEGAGASDELEEVEEELKGVWSTESEDDPADGSGKTVAAKTDKKTDWLISKSASKGSLSYGKALKMIYTIFFMVLMAEWGDKSQVATIAMGAARDVGGVVAGWVFGHACCTSVACLGGKLLAEYCSERAVLTGSGVLFLIFAAQAVIQGPEE